jgi:hypothetical protein
LVEYQAGALQNIEKEDVTILGRRMVGYLTGDSRI